jgi:hypothetical protein
MKTPSLLLTEREALLGIIMVSGTGVDPTYLLSWMLGTIVTLIALVSFLPFFRPEALSGLRCHVK